jgi:hypothetical protein
LDPEEEFYLLENGSLWVPETLGMYDHDFCMEYMGSRNGTHPVLCFLDDTGELPLKMYPIGMIISIPFLIATLAFYLFLPDLKGIHAKCVSVYVTSLILSYTSLSFIQLYDTPLDDFACTFLGKVYFPLYYFRSLVNRDDGISSNFITLHLYNSQHLVTIISKKL